MFPISRGRIEAEDAGDRVGGAGRAEEGVEGGRAGEPETHQIEAVGRPGRAEEAGAAAEGEHDRAGPGGHLDQVGTVAENQGKVVGAGGVGTFPLLPAILVESAGIGRITAEILGGACQRLRRGNHLDGGVVEGDLRWQAVAAGIGGLDLQPDRVPTCGEGDALRGGLGAGRSGQQVVQYLC